MEGGGDRVMETLKIDLALLAGVVMAGNPRAGASISLRERSPRSVAMGPRNAMTL
jgi:hypothetical protein